MASTFIKEVAGSRLVDALIVISGSQTPTVARPAPSGIPPPELMLMVVAAIAAEDKSPKSNRISRNGLL
jgi:IMP cyclohydrolase